MLKISNLNINVLDNLVIQDLNLAVLPGQVHAVMGPNGSGKSSLALALMGHPDYQIVSGEATFLTQDLLKLAVHERAKIGLFLAFQYPRSISGLKVFDFLKTIYESFRGGAISVADLDQKIQVGLELVGLNPSFKDRFVNDGFSGGEQKRFEILQLWLLQPKLAIIDEIDSGLDVDALKMVGQVLANCLQQNPQMSVILITHYQRILNYLKPDQVHILHRGKLIKSAGPELATQIEQSGYEIFL